MCAKISLEIAPTLESYGVENVQLGLEGEHQQINAAPGCCTVHQLGLS
jgi:hypothetical protein